MSTTPPPPTSGTGSRAGSPRVALVHDWLTGMRGGEKVLESFAEIFPEAPLYTLFHFPGSVSETLERHPIHTSYLQKAPWIRSQYRRYLPFFPTAIEDFDLGGYDLVVSTSHCVAKGAIPAPDAFHVCYCHTPMRYAWDQEHAYFPQRRGLIARLRNLILTAMRSWDVATAPRVDLFVANSRFVAERIRRYYGRSAEVIPPPVDTEFFTPRAPEPDAPEPYALAVSALVPYKRIDWAAAACAASGLPLVVVGTGPDLERLRRQTATGARFVGRVDDEELRTLYRDAVCFVQPGVEDFGIAAVEALACGTPVVARARGGVLDIVDHGEHGVLYDPDDPDDPESQIAALRHAVDKARQIRFNELDLRQRAERFSIRHFDRRIRELLESQGFPGRGSHT